MNNENLENKSEIGKIKEKIPEKSEKFKEKQIRKI